VLAVVLLAGLFMVEFPKIPLPHSPVVGFVMPDGAAAKAGILEGDQVLQVDDQVDPTWEDIQLKEVTSARRPMEVWVQRAGKRLHFTITPNYDEKQAIGYAGWLQETEVQVVGFYAGIETAERAGLKPGDIIVSVNGQPIRNTSRMREVIDKANGSPVAVVFLHNRERHEASVEPVRKEIDGQTRWMIGVSLEPKYEIVKLPFAQAVAESTRQNIQSAKLIFKVLEGIVERRMSPKSLEGPIRIAQLSGDAARQGAATFIGLMAAVSLNLAIVNLIPIPILDGGVILMLLVEMLMRRDLDLRVKEAVVKVGFVFLMVVLVFVIYNDLSKILPPG
jgi:regulator of sigma E protease